MATEAEKKLARSKAAQKAAETRRANKIAAERREEETNSNTNWFSWLPWVLLGLFILGLLIWHPWTTTVPAAPTETPVVTATEAPVVTDVPTEPVATEAPIVPTEAPVVTTEAPVIPVAVSCDSPSIKAGLTTADTEYGEYLDTILGERMTFTSRKVIVPVKAWNDPLTANELKSVENTWLFMQVCIPEGTTGRIFASGYEQGVNRYENGVLMTLNPGLYEFRMRNGEVVIWYPNQQNFASDDLVRIIEQIRNGNFDIKSSLAFFGVTTDLLSKIPDDLVKERNVQLVPFPDKILK